MRSKMLLTLVTVLALAAGIFVVSAQQPDEDIRGAFLESRPKTTNLNQPSRRHRRRAAATKANANTNVAANSSSSATNANSNRNPSKRPAQAIGLGYTLFMRDASGRGIRVEPTREFLNGDRVRLALEPNTDGYLYIFDSENGGPPRMIFPDGRLDEGENWIEAHVPIEVPSSEEIEERLRWYTFDGPPGGDRVYIVLTREPLKSVPTSEELVALCGLNKDKCTWQPSSEVWMPIQNATQAQVKVATVKNFGQAQTDRERIATTRGLGLDKDAPPPTVIRMNASTTEPMLVTVLDLVHK